MSKTIMGLLAIVALVSVIVISFTSADAAGKPTIMKISENAVLGFGPACGSDNPTAKVHYEGTSTVWPDTKMKKLIVITTGELIDEDGVVIAKLNGKHIRQNTGYTDDNGVIKVTITLTAHCFDGGKVKLETLHTIKYK